jgi:hypothetical protein
MHQSRDAIHSKDAAQVLSNVARKKGRSKKVPTRGNKPPPFALKRVETLGELREASFLVANGADTTQPVFSNFHAFIRYSTALLQTVHCSDCLFRLLQLNQTTSREVGSKEQ